MPGGIRCWDRPGAIPLFRTQIKSSKLCALGERRNFRRLRFCVRVGKFDSKRRHWVRCRKMEDISRLTRLSTGAPVPVVLLVRPTRLLPLRITISPHHLNRSRNSDIALNPAADEATLLRLDLGAARVGLRNVVQTQVKLGRLSKLSPGMAPSTDKPQCWESQNRRPLHGDRCREGTNRRCLR
jgi:hypothetical protein